MENVTLFLCDIYGTYIRSNELVPEPEIKRFLDNLENLRVINNSEKIIFSFISTENEKIVKKQCENLKLNNDYKNIEFGIQFFENGYINKEKTVYNEASGKISQILFYLEKIKHNYNIDKIYYADDLDIYHFMLENLLISDSLEDKLCSIIPNAKDGLKELNHMLEKNLEEKKYKIKNV